MLSSPSTLDEGWTKFWARNTKNKHCPIRGRRSSFSALLLQCCEDLSFMTQKASLYKRHLHIHSQKELGVFLITNSLSKRNIHNKHSYTKCSSSELFPIQWICETSLRIWNELKTTDWVKDRHPSIHTYKKLLSLYGVSIQDFKFHMNAPIKLC